jgi:hypothetical protein
MPYNVHISDIRNFRSCRRKWDWSSGLRHNLEPVVPYAPFFIGRAIHHCLEWYYGPEHRDVWTSLDHFLDNETKIAGNLWTQEQQMWEESVDLVTELLGHYMLWVQVDPSPFNDSFLEFLDLEIPFNVPMYNPDTGEVDPEIRLEGRFDGIVKHKPTGTFWIWECKTTRSIKELVKSFENDEQAGAYIYAAEQLHDIHIEGVLYNMLRKRAPSHPRILQDGYVSKQKGDYTVFSYVADLKKAHPDWPYELLYEHYGSVIATMSIMDNEFFSRIPVKRSTEEITNLMGNLYWTSKEMVDPNTRVYPIPNFIQCNMCPFRAPCLAMNRNGNYEALLRAEYQKRIKAESYREVEL